MVLQVSGDTQEVHLVNLMPGGQEPYLALSYCWGQYSQNVILLKENIDQLKAGIQIASLDQTIRDAIAITRTLGYKYLWVDALCIVQDDDTFKSTEIARMGQIYRNATICITASRSSNVKEGFLSERMPRAPDTVFSINVNDPGMKSIKRVILLPLSSGYSIHDELEMPFHSPQTLEPWEKRAWTLQEDLLSARQLRFDSDKTTWTCKCSASPCTMTDGWIREDVGSPSMKFKERFFDRTMKKVRESEVSVEGDLTLWYDMVKEYSIRQLSNKNDKLPAISALAKECAMWFKDEYVCGHWKFCLPYELLWTHYDVGPNGPELLRPATRPPPYHRAEAAAFVEILDISVDLEYSHLPYGAVKAARLFIQGKIIAASAFGTITAFPGNMRLVLDGDKMIETSETFHRSTNLELDYPEEIIAGDVNVADLFLLVVLPVGRQTGLPHGLVLLSHRDNVFSRVGVFYVFNSELKATRRLSQKGRVGQITLV
ncbi:heterokaryon incompatibility protein-domain-containing protein [Hypoxylon sp. NC1633]|nr:heterokaryon incompatibility protein-domain-containing protein [Hypoxylon sp. NC1633]